MLVTIKCPKCGNITPREIDAEHPLTCFACTGKFWPPFYVDANGDVHMYKPLFQVWEAINGAWERRDTI